MECVDGHGSNEVCAIWLFPNRNDNELNEIEVWRCADELRDGSKRWGIVFHDAGDCIMGDDFKLFVVSN